MYRSSAPAMGSMDMEYNEEMTDKMSDKDKKAYGDYETKGRAEDDVHTLMRAKEIESDKERHAMAIHCAKMKREEINKVAKGE